MSGLHYGCMKRRLLHSSTRLLVNLLGLLLWLICHFSFFLFFCGLRYLFYEHVLLVHRAIEGTESREGCVCWVIVQGVFRAQLCSKIHAAWTWRARNVGVGNCLRMQAIARNKAITRGIDSRVRSI